MSRINKIDYMIHSLYLAKEELEYAEAYRLRKATDKSFDKDFYSGYGKDHRPPNGTVARESLRMVSRLASQVANEIILGNNNDDRIYLDDER